MTKPADDDEFPLLARLDDRIDKLRKLVAAALKDFDEDAIHDARVATRRLKAALDLLDPVLTKANRKPLADVLKKLRRRLGPLRDADVMLGHLAEIAKRSPRRAAAARWLGDELRRQRDDERAKASRRGGTGQALRQLGTWWALREEVAEAREAVGSLLGQSLHLQLDAFAERADALAAGAAPGGRGVSSADGADAPDAAAARLDPHELRIAGKALRYTLEMAVEAGHKLPARIAKTFKAMQEALGLWHDFVVLTETAMRTSLDALLAHHDAALQAGVMDLARATLQRSSKELAKFAALWRDRGDELARSVRDAFPLTRAIEPAGADGDAGADAGPARAGEPTLWADPAVTEPQTDPDQTDSAPPAIPESPAPDEPSAA